MAQRFTTTVIWSQLCDNTTDGVYSTRQLYGQKQKVYEDPATLYN